MVETRLATTAALLGTVPSPGLRAKGRLQPGAEAPPVLAPFFCFKGNPHLLTTLAFLLPFRLAQVEWVGVGGVGGSTAQVPSLNLRAGLEALGKSHPGLV